MSQRFIDRKMPVNRKAYCLIEPI